MFSVALMVCVLYFDGERYCDIRSNKFMSFASKEDCRRQTMAAVERIKANAEKDEFVVGTFTTYSSCSGGVEQLIANAKASGTNYTHTEY